MAYEIQAEDNYNRIRIDELFGIDDFADLVSNLHDGLLHMPFLIIQAEPQIVVGKEVVDQFSQFNSLIQEKVGLMLFVDFGEEDTQLLNSVSLTTIPSFDEAVDYIFMDQLEKELDSE